MGKKGMGIQMKIMQMKYFALFLLTAAAVVVGTGGQRAAEQTADTGGMLGAAFGQDGEAPLHRGGFAQLPKPVAYDCNAAEAGFNKAGFNIEFNIEEGGCDTLLKGLLNGMSDMEYQEGAEGVCGVSFGIHILAYSQGAYPCFGSADLAQDVAAQISRLADLLLSKQDEAGSLYEDYEATAIFSGIMAMGSEFGGRHNIDSYSQYYAAAKRAWSWLERQECDTEGKSAARFYAAAQFFRIENTGKYRRIVEEFLRQEPDSYTENKAVFYGALAYLDTDRKADRDLCARIMQSLVNETQRICGANTAYGIGTRTLEGNLSNLLLLSLMNDITPSKEYTSMMRNIMQYVSGCLDQAGVWQGTAETAGRNPEWNAILLFGVGGLLNH